jgi:hypothetical protein
MALVIEDGSAKPDAQSYVSVADVVTYATLYGFSHAHVDEAVVMRAMRYLEGAYFERWIGLKRTEEQALSWPRAWATRQDGYTNLESAIPVEVKNAVCALAIRSTTGVNHSPDISRSDVAIEEEIGPIRVKYATNAPRVTVYRDIDLMLKPVLRSNGVNSRIYRS